MCAPKPYAASAPYGCPTDQVDQLVDLLPEQVLQSRYVALTHIEDGTSEPETSYVEPTGPGCTRSPVPNCSPPAGSWRTSSDWSRPHAAPTDRLWRPKRWS